ncbi:MAG: hypothetical protein L0Z62_09660 [Gemmataceae bacterium]|nr:hypothetical protein [Gemmataceae bacterium]
MLTLPVPDYFQEDSEDALRSRVQWLEAEVGLGDPFFTRLLRMDGGTFTRWKEHRAALAPRELLGLREVWDMMLHILSFVNFDSGRARRLLEHVATARTRPVGRFTPTGNQPGAALGGLVHQDLPGNARPRRRGRSQPLGYVVPLWRAFAHPGTRGAMPVSPGLGKSVPVLFVGLACQADK